jgi:branched-subunit amino acid ABC-type transport system permease component
MFFITNSFAAFYKKYYVYSLLFFILTLTSLIVHSNNTIYTNIIDKLAVGGIILYGAYMLYTKMSFEKFLEISLIVSTFFICIFLYVYGYYTESFCYHPEKRIRELYHIVLHFIASLGHHFIIFLV